MYPYRALFQTKKKLTETWDLQNFCMGSRAAEVLGSGVSLTSEVRALRTVGSSSKCLFGVANCRFPRAGQPSGQDPAIEAANRPFPVRVFPVHSRIKAETFLPCSCVYFLAAVTILSRYAYLFVCLFTIFSFQITVYILNDTMVGGLN